MKKTLLDTTDFSNTYNCYVLVAYRHELNAKKPVKATVMGLDVIVVQNSKGEISVLDGYCPHMGAPLAGGKIIDDCIVCPFHSWTFNTDGQRVNEHGEPLKKQARTIQKYPVKVVGEYIFAWFEIVQKRDFSCFQTSKQRTNGSKISKNHADLLTT